MKTTDDLHALAALAEAATQQHTMSGLAVTIHHQPTDEDHLAFITAAAPRVVRELVERVLKAEALLRDSESCPDHAANCCASWCEHCKNGAAWEQSIMEYWT